MKTKPKFVDHNLLVGVPGKLRRHTILVDYYVCCAKCCVEELLQDLWLNYQRAAKEAREFGWGVRAGEWLCPECLGGER